MAPTVDEFRRYLQARRHELQNIVDPEERERIRLRIDISLQEALDFSAAVEIREALDSKKFQDVDSSTRLIESADNISNTRIEGDGCPKCEGPLEEDLSFCPSCGHTL
mgnify:CR=1 FL=1|tara:strand:- start:40 stop:363 length:324 start_codon:yes stop_codon:yes gene_type:complete